MAEKMSKNPSEHLGYHSSEIATSLSSEPNASSEDQEPPPYSAREPAESSAVFERNYSRAREAGFSEASQVATQQGSSSTPATASSSQGRPIAIPAIDSARESPFLRSYAPLLNQHNIPKDKFLTFLDELNDVMTTSPPMQVLDATGGILKSVPILFPLHWIGSVVSGLANLGGQGISKSRSDSTIRQANKDIFMPHGLKAQIAKLDALAHIAKIPILDSQGKVNKKAPLVRKLSELSTAPVDESQELDLQQRRIRVLQPWIAELELYIKPWTSKSRLTRFNAALRKRNDARDQDPESSERPDAEEEDTGFRKSLWLIIRKAEDEN
ncbi:hypothetical protein N7448_008054 [Penicillium atrosanguineum]|uniref:Uncharacterized protein n=1 Tax=Penicillium atrosanguineum TaxID=1132637 RepID=A0A9W9QE07_9EURO|nr:uncharacterized protein N7443_000927 [Penicillium atrosanguineum]KAJ5127275.1 hypothetical protein N7448_008054 [Penicillium atrosanguineum]KAJ5147481.1 hypothetical protein N7526_000833 [Penicillium atrosanguineum]KAJ5314043.1 hypothetical protein N7443_000927 [Penicillium atrosanguineum]KAJ5331209.1 hypothetical protein N7476_000992 [Penicillium atrosanguineum]